MKFRRNLLSRLYRNSDPDADSGGGGAPVVESAPVVTDTPAAPAESASAAPGSMLEAMFGQKTEVAPTVAETQEALATGKTVQQLRDERGRFASGKAEPAVDPTKPAEVKKPDANGMPEGLTPKAQERFQTLANTNKELSTRVQEWEPIVNSARELQQTFQQHGIRREQFDHAMQMVGLMNRGDLQGALRMLDDQRTQISLALGKPLPGADALASFPDLRQAVDNLQVSEEYAMEVARGRFQQHRGQQAAQAQRQQDQAHQQEQQAVQREEQAKNNSMLAVDKFCKARMADDLDFARVEPLLLAQIQGGLLEGIPYAARPALIEKTYALIKQTATATRSAAPSTSVLRPTGGESPRQAPKTMHEAMWGGR